LVIAEVIAGRLQEGMPVPSVRQLAAQHEVNPLTVSRAYQELATEGLLEKRRGVGWFVAAGSGARLLAQERAEFLAHQWPSVVARAQRLGLSLADLLKK